MVYTIYYAYLPGDVCLDPANIALTPTKPPKLKHRFFFCANTFYFKNTKVFKKSHLPWTGQHSFAHASFHHLLFLLGAEEKN